MKTGRQNAFRGRAVDMWWATVDGQQGQFGEEELKNTGWGMQWCGEVEGGGEDVDLKGCGA